jgi:transposase
MDGPELFESIVDAPTDERPATPFSQILVTITKQEYIALIANGNSSKSAHQRALKRIEDLKQDHRCELARAHIKAQKREDFLQFQLDKAQGRIRDLEQRLFGRKSEKQAGVEEQFRDQSAASRRRGQQPGRTGHGRTRLTHLPAEVEDHVLDSPCCERCGRGFAAFPGTEDSEIIEIEVQAHRRVIRRHRYRPVCGCPELPGIVTAPAPDRLIERGKYGVSVWVHVLLDKFAYGRPSERTVQQLAGHGLPMAPGSLAGGLKRIAPLFAPIQAALLERLRSQHHWHADETRWAVFAERQGKVGHRWYLWVFQSREASVYVLDPSRSAAVPADALGEKADGIISCDRYAAYKRVARTQPEIMLQFCWAHQRRDFLTLANAYPELAPWAMRWVECIGVLYTVHRLRGEVEPGDAQFDERDRRVRELVEEIRTKREEALACPGLPQPAIKLLLSMRRHWAGLTTFVDHCEVGLDNNAAERALRGAVVGRKNYYGSGSLWSGQLAATMFSLFATLGQWQINPQIWLGAYLQACARNARQPPADLGQFLPWQMSEARLRTMRCAGGQVEEVRPPPNTS